MTEQELQGIQQALAKIIDAVRSLARDQDHERAREQAQDAQDILLNTRTRKIP